MTQESTINSNNKIRDFGREIFTLIGSSQPSAFQKNFINSKLLAWTLNEPDFKNSLFRLVDVLPTLKTADSVGKHISEYLSESAGKINPLLKYFFKLPSYNFIPAIISKIAVRTSIKQMSKVFIAGENPQAALPALKKLYSQGLTYTVDLLGEYSVSDQESLAYLSRYQEALTVIAQEAPGWKKNFKTDPNHLGLVQNCNISVKLTALYSQTSILNLDQSVEILSARLKEIALEALRLGSGIYVDAEDTAHNPIIYATFKKVFSDPELAELKFPGVVLQAYAKHSEELLVDLLDWAKDNKRPIAIRLVKGAYWDQENAGAAQNYWKSPLFQIKAESDLNYERLSCLLIDNIEHCYPAFGSHNVRSLSQICCYAEEKGISKNLFELQMLYGMAQPIALAFASKGYLVRLYVPLGEILPGMGYLVRRLLENTSNDSFLRHTFYDQKNVDHLLEDPAITLNKLNQVRL